MVATGPVRGGGGGEPDGGQQLQQLPRGLRPQEIQEGVQVGGFGEAAARVGRSLAEALGGPGSGGPAVRRSGVGSAIAIVAVLPLAKAAKAVGNQRRSISGLIRIGFGLEWWPSGQATPGQPNLATLSRRVIL